MKVLKFGGSSLADLNLIKEVSKNIKQKLKADKKLIVVASAMGKTTNELIEKMQNSSTKINARELDQLLSTGEIQSISLLANTLCDLGVKAKSLAGWQAGIITNENHTDAEIKKIEKVKIEKELKENDVLLIAGFQGICNGEVTTLGRGGSDTTAVALASQLKCPCEIYTDVDGVYSVDPRIKKNATKFDELSYDQMITMSKAGAKVLESRCSELAKKNNVDLYIGKSLEQAKGGTKIVPNVKLHSSKGILSIAVRSNLGIIKILAHNEKELQEINENLSNLKCEKFSEVKYNKGAVVSAYFDKSQIKEIEKNFRNNLKQIKLNFSKISLIGCETFNEKKEALRHLKSLKNQDMALKTLSEGVNYISFAVPEKKSFDIVKGLSDEFEI